MPRRASAAQPLRVPGFRRLAALLHGQRARRQPRRRRAGDPGARSDGLGAGTTALFVAARFVPALLAPLLTAGLDQRPVGTCSAALYALEAVAFAGLAPIAAVFSLGRCWCSRLPTASLALTARGADARRGRGLLARAALREGNALINVAFAASSAAGPVLGGIVTRCGAATALWIDAGSFLVIALAARGGALPAPRPADAAGWRERCATGCARRRGARRCAGLITGRRAIVFFTLDHPDRGRLREGDAGRGTIGYGVLLGSWGVGMLVGSGVFARGAQRSLR